MSSKVCSTTSLVYAFDLSSLATTLTRTGERSIPAQSITDPIDWLNATSAPNLTMIKGLIDRCMSQHTKCSLQLPITYPTRLLHVAGEGVQLRLAGRSRGQYIALSYAWSGTSLPLTLSSNIESRLRQPFALTDLPLTLQDAVIMTRKLEIQYLWIDCLCIIQDSEIDKDNELPRMGNIFSNAYLVLSSDAANDPTTGFLDRSNHITYTIVTIQNSRSSTSTYILRSKKTHADYGRLRSRAWCYQERVLAQRALIFDLDEVLLECKEGRSCECGEERDRKYTSLASVSQFSKTSGYIISVKELNTDIEPYLQRTHVSWVNPTIYQYWLIAVCNYSRRALSFWTDRLPAISALASLLAEELVDDYLAGLWRRDLLTGLVWEVHHIKKEDEVIPDQQTLCGYIAPSWSWASLLRPVYWNSNLFKRKNASIATVLEAVCEHKGYRFGEIKSGFIRLRAPVLNAIMQQRSGCSNRFEFLIQTKHGTYRICDKRFGPMQGDFKFDEWYRVDDDIYVHTARPALPHVRVEYQNGAQILGYTASVRLLWLTAFRALMLVPSQSYPGHFKRCGLMQTSEDDGFTPHEDVTTIY